MVTPAFVSGSHSLPLCVRSISNYLFLQACQVLVVGLHPVQYNFNLTTFAKTFPYPISEEGLIHGGRFKVGTQFKPQGIFRKSVYPLLSSSHSWLLSHKGRCVLAIHEGWRRTVRDVACRSYCKLAQTRENKATQLSSAPSFPQAVLSLPALQGTCCKEVLSLFPCGLYP